MVSWAHMATSGLNPEQILSRLLGGLMVGGQLFGNTEACMLYPFHTATTSLLPLSTPNGVSSCRERGATRHKADWMRTCPFPLLPSFVDVGGARMRFVEVKEGDVLLSGVRGYKDRRTVPGHDLVPAILIRTSRRFATY
jgi:hypothetical protein